jgi:hypothetical protein
VGAAEISAPRDHHTGVGDRVLQRWEINAWIAGRVMCDGRKRIAIGLRDVLSRDSAGFIRLQADRAAAHPPGLVNAMGR